MSVWAEVPERSGGKRVIPFKEGNKKGNKKFTTNYIRKIMEKAAAKRLIQDTFQNSFVKDKFIYFTKNILNRIDESKAFHARGYVPEIFKEHIKTYERTGTYTDPEDNKTDILIVYLKKETTLDRARTAQRNFVARYLKDRGEKDAAIVAFVSPEDEDWRFSFVKMEYRFVETPKGDTKAKEEFTPAKRYSFLVGKNEDSHTAKISLIPLLINDDNDPLLAELEDAFSIEKVTKEFFGKYRELFLDAKKALDEIVEKDEKIKADFIENDVSTVDFCKKLLGQIVFLYFLQKKGWFGVKRGKEWGTGSKHFLRELFKKKHAEYKNFFNDILEPLFYNTLAVERSKDYADRFDCKIPFLNGGLFDPINNYEWIETEILLPDALFSNDIQTKDGDKGTGILDVFDRYNFTVKEDEPLEKEVAVDPEMLGKVFENLLEVKDRKSKGTYYTPREIVHYMCQESLINYLVSELDGKVTKEDIDQLIKYGETVVEHDMRVVSKGKETEAYSFKLPESIRDYAALIDEKLANIRVCDPAIGSGAFPLGMMSEIVRARHTLTTYLSNEDNRTMYNFKRHAIHNCLYGVDIDPGAVEIAKLRLWLSLMVDEEDINHIKPLPNLDYKIMQGNSLLEEFEGIKLFDEKLISSKPFDETQINEIKEKQSELQKEFIDLHNRGKLTKAERTRIEAEQGKLAAMLKKITAPQKDSGQESMVYEVRAGEIAEKLKKLHEEFFEAYHINKKIQLKEQIDSLEWELIETTLKEHKNEDALSKLEQFKRSNTKPFFLWKLNFSEVFQEKGGFDVVIANPPYFSLETASLDLKKALKKQYKVFAGKADIVYFFFEQGINLLHERGKLTFITSRYYLEATYAKNLRGFIAANTGILSLIDFQSFKVFESASIHTLLTFLQKGPTLTKTKIKKLLSDKISSMYDHNCFKTFDNALEGEEWILTSNEQFKVFKRVQDVSTTLCDIAVIEQGQKTGKNSVYNISESFAEDLEKKPLKKLIKNSHIEKYHVTYRNRYLIYCDDLFDINKFPKIGKYLKRHKSDLLNRAEARDGLYKWYRIQRPRDKTLFEADEKIVVPYRAPYNKFAYDDQQYYNDGGDIRIGSS